MEEAPKTKLQKLRRCHSNVWVLLFSVYDVLPLPWSSIGCTRVKPHHFSNPLHLVSRPLTPVVTACECIFNVFCCFATCKPFVGPPSCPTLTSAPCGPTLLYTGQPTYILCVLWYNLYELHINYFWFSLLKQPFHIWSWISKTKITHLLSPLRNPGKEASTRVVAKW